MIRGAWLLGVACLVAWSSCKNDLERVAAIEVPVDGPDRVTTDAEYYYSDSGKVLNRLRAGTISEYTDEKASHYELSNGVELTFYDSTGHPGSKLTARRGSILPNEHRMQVQENVVFINAKGEKLETEQLTWSQDSGRVHTDQPVKITRAKDIIYGLGMDADQDFSRYTIRQITGALYLDRSDTLVPLKPTP